MPRFVTVLPPREGFGPGRAGAVGLLAHRLALADRESVVVGGPQGGEPFRDVTFHAVTPPWFLPLGANRRYAVAAAHLLRQLRPDLVEVYNRPDIALTLARRLRPLPVCLILQNDPQGMRGCGTPRQRAATMRRLARVICASEFLRRRVVDGVATLPPLPPVVVHNPLDLAALPPSRPRERLVLFVGRIVREKGPDTFATACASALPRLPGWRAEIIGADRFRADSPETEFAAVVRAAAEGAGIRAIGYRDHDTVLQAMASAAIVVMPSRWQEPFGLVALEALASGAALICSDRGGLREVAGDAAIYIDPDDPAELSAAIRGLAADPARRAALAQAGQDRAKLFDVGTIAARLAAVRQEVLDAAGG